jgi:hypothetical protein
VSVTEASSQHLAQGGRARRAPASRYTRTRRSTPFRRAIQPRRRIGDADGRLLAVHPQSPRPLSLANRGARLNAVSPYHAAGTVDQFASPVSPNRQRAAKSALLLRGKESRPAWSPAVDPHGTTRRGNQLDASMNHSRSGSGAYQRAPLVSHSDYSGHVDHLARRALPELDWGHGFLHD